MDVSIADAHNHLSSLVDKAEKEPVNITRHGKIVAVLISANEYESLRQLKAKVLMSSLSHQLHDSINAQDLYRISRQELDEIS